VTAKQELIYDLIFSEKTEYKIDISEYIKDIYRYDEFVAEIKSILKKSKVSVVKSNVLLDSKTAIWDLKVKK
jgi:hypothetical protein